ncbi:MAG: methyltransferase type 12 [Planctomycetes bacterium RBG_16_41_13]|nr:MAG: methyltransferase type 12 [Planctomycetes bacterium RBG_16_41_13]
MYGHSIEISQGKRFEFGKNWTLFLRVLNDERIDEAEKSLKQKLGVEDLQGKSFLDIGSGSGLFSLAARRLGATVQSFDYDSNSVACTQKLKQCYFPDDPSWIIEEGSVLDKEYLKSLGQFDIVYSWGVLHHTGAMWQALENAQIPVSPGGKLFISIYNDQGSKSVRWRWIKKIYCSGTLGKYAVISIFVPYFIFGGLAIDILKRKNPIRRYIDYKKNRGMSHVHDWIDWLGGYPFEVAKPEEIFDFYRERGCILEKLKCCGGGLGCNEFVFVKRNV